MSRPLSLAARLTLFFGIAAAVVFPVFGWVIIESMENHFEEGDTDELKIIADAVEGALSAIGSSAELALIEPRFDDILVGHHSASLLISDTNGNTLYASSRTPDLTGAIRGMSMETTRESVGRWSDSHHSYQVLLRRLPSKLANELGASTIAVAVPIDHHMQFIASFRRTLWLMTATSIAVMSLMGWIAVRQGHAPLRDIVARMRRISANEMSSGVAPDSVPRELSDLALSFNDMLQRVEEAFQRLSHFNADIAHELRTPVTNLMTQTQVALSRARTIDEYREVLYSNMEEYERMAKMVGDMLFLAQADSGTCIADVGPVDLTKEMRTLCDYYEGWADERGVALEVHGDAAIEVEGDRLMLQRALGNVLANAIRHTPAGGSVRIVLTAHNGEVSVNVENTGEPIPPEHLPKLFDRFYRADPSRQRRGEGAGLGLAIAKSIIDAHGGTIAVTSNEARTAFEIVLPKTATTAPSMEDEPARATSTRQSITGE